MITNKGKEIIAKYMLGQAPAYATHIALGCGPKPNSTGNFSEKQTMDFEMLRVPISSKGFVNEGGISKLALSLKGNTLVLFQFVEKHGKVLYEMMKDKGKKVFFVYGGTDVDDRESIRKIVEKEENAIIIASYGTFSTGISIKRLHNIVFSSPSKSRIRVLQSIGRQLRKSEFKEKARLYDIADDLSWKSYQNHTLRHFVERIKIYESEKFEHRKIVVPVKES